MDLKITLTLLSALLCCISPLHAGGRGTIDFPNHHIHNFTVNAETYEHALAMGYRLVTHDSSIDPSRIPNTEHIGRIRKHNAEVCPLRVYRRKSDGALFVSYHSYVGTNEEGLNPVASQFGIRRHNTGFTSRVPMEEEDLEILKLYGAAKEPVAELTLSGLTYQDIQKSFHLRWPLEDDTWASANILCNWRSRWVVDSMAQTTISNVPWQEFDALFFDTLSDGTEMTANAEAGGRGVYQGENEGKLAFVKRVVEHLRDPKRSGLDRPYLVFANIWDPLGKPEARKWYASGGLVLDHYYFEKGAKAPAKKGYALGQQRANGTVPGSSEPAYVNKTSPEQAPIPHIPANLVSLDDAYTWSRLLSKKPHFDHEGFFLQHLDACGTAGIQGSWFGWYGEDRVNAKDTEGNLIYTAANQLLRAIPNWDNMRYIPVPPFQTYSSSDARKWDGNVYQSDNSYASSAIVYSRHPDTGELFAVFHSPNASLPLRPGERIISAHFANPMFSKTHQDATPALELNVSDNALSLTDPDRLGQGIRIATRQSR